MSDKHQPDIGLFALIVLLSGFGLVALIAVAAWWPNGQGDFINDIVARQIVAVSVGTVALAATAAVDYRRWRRPLPLYAPLVVCLVLLGLVTILGGGVLTQRYWPFGEGFRLRPADFVTPCLILWISSRLAAFAEAIPTAQVEEQTPSWNAILAECSVPTVLAFSLYLMAKDYKDAVVLLLPVGGLLVVAGVPWRFTLVPPASLAAFAFAFRSNFRSLQSQLVIGSGGFLGRGRGAEGLGSLPNTLRNFTFAAVAAEFGLAGALVVLILFLWFLARGVRVARGARDPFGRYLAVGWTLMIVSQAFLHMSVNLGFLPATGIPLPFFSAGVAALVIDLAACGVLLNISRHG